MRRLLYTLALAAFGFAASYAQQPVKRSRLNADERAEKVASAMQQKLSLNNEQKAKIKQIELNKFKQQDEWRKQNAEANKNNFEQRKEALKNYRADVDAVLTPEQRKTLAASREEMKTKAKERFRERHQRKEQKAPEEKS